MPDVDGLIVLGLNVADTTTEINNGLNTVISNIGKKEIVLSARIDKINFGNASSQIKNVTDQINQEFRSTLNVIDLVNGGIGNLSRMLQGAGFSKGSISTVTQDLQKMSLQISKITTTMSQNGNIQLRISGTDEMQRAVTIVRQYDSETGKVVNTSKRFVQSFEQGIKAARDFSNTLKQAEKALATNRIDATIAKVTAQYESLGKTGHEKLSAIKTDIDELTRLQQTMTTSQDAATLVESYRQYQDILERVKNNISVVTSSIQNQGNATDKASSSTDTFAKQLERVNDAISSNKIEASIVSVTESFNKFGSTGHEKLSQIETDIKTLNDLQREMTSGKLDSKTFVSTYEQYEQVLSRVKNNLSIVSNETKSYTNSVKEAERAQNTLTKSSTLSNKIQTWMDQNAKAAQRYGDELRKLQATLSNNTDVSVLAKANTQFANIQSQAKAAGLTTNQFAENVKNVGLQLLGLSNGYMVLRKLISLIQEGVNTVIELDTALVDLQKTTTMSGSQLTEFYSEANEAAKELGVTTKDIIQSAADWSRLGFSDKDSAESMAKLAAQFSAISPGVGIEEATTGLVSVIKAYGIEVDDVLDGIMSKINIIGNTAATSNQEIITGLQGSASAMAAMNSSLEENIALFTAAQEISQDASRVGNALRTIAMRIRGYDEETEQLSDDLVNITGEVVELTKTAKNPEGVSLFTDETQTEYKSVYQYLKEISEIYDDLSAKQQQDLMEKLFGKMRANIGQAILRNFDAAEKAMDNMSKSAGNADAEMSIITESLEYKMNALKETGVGIFQEMFPRETIGNIIELLTGLLNILGAITSALGPLGTAVAGIGLTAFIKNLD